VGRALLQVREESPVTTRVSSGQGCSFGKGGFLGYKRRASRKVGGGSGEQSEGFIRASGDGQEEEALCTLLGGESAWKSGTTGLGKRTAKKRFGPEYDRREKAHYHRSLNKKNYAECILLNEGSRRRRRTVRRALE